MAKMFYNLKEAASRLGITPDEVQRLVEQGKLQQFRDRDKLMFKRDQVEELVSLRETSPLEAEEQEDDGELSLDDTVDALATKTDKIELIADADATASGNGTALNLELGVEEDDGRAGTSAITLDEQEGEETGALNLSDTTGIALSAQSGADTNAATAPLRAEEGPSGTGTMELEELSFEDTGPVETAPPKKKPRQDAGRSKAGATGISVFDTHEIEAGDSMARTQVTKAFVQETEEELNLEAVGSGSGLLDLTREADDTSLGAVELLDDIAPAGETAPGGTMSGTIGGSVPGSATGIFEGAAEAEAAAATSGTITAEGEAPSDEPELAPTSYAVTEETDPVGDAWGGATLLGAFAVLVIAATIAITAIQGQLITLAQQFTTLANRNDPQQSLFIMLGALLGANILLLVIGLFIGKSRAKRA